MEASHRGDQEMVCSCMKKKKNKKEPVHRRRRRRRRAAVSKLVCNYSWRLLEQKRERERERERANLSCWSEIKVKKSCSVIGSRLTLTPCRKKQIIVLEWVQVTRARTPALFSLTISEKSSRQYMEKKELLSKLQLWCWKLCIKDTTRYCRSTIFNKKFNIHQM